ncbi:Sensor histidine kinase RcsC [Roseobacter fucihabitans]|uniref:Sensor histidine kinase RcsC n=1 Tax=Roseobacter fucihabitans TaxID=1537242 RepID=A0ABZ2BYW1_9RHOB|nr:SpoIIE family protein phosphatase [Roseobacter litoralis]MBC6963851.1 Alkaline phosphatase synthesis transcriptional regulatory protein PhoP [Roseobacter litoralis]MBC6964064.1 Alkaline phosphatase synthesis transcriptional regulatory protein PhoP [Roseobacter litoralis]
MLVLVVDDSRLQRKILSSSLKRWGFEVMEADSGEMAMEICRTHSPEVVLSDWMMPGMSGIDFCKAFRELSGEAYSYFILLTSKSEKNEVAEGLDAGADDFLTKPVDGNELRARITAGERILEMQRELTIKNKVITETLDELQRLYDSLDGDLLEAKKLQQSLVPERFRSFPSGDLSLLLRSSGHVGGDLVGFYPAGEGHLGLFAIDVSGHGISSALMTARLAGYLSATALDQNVALEKLTDGTFRSRPPGEAIATLNEMVLDEMETEHYFTLMLADIDLITGKMLVGQAGHPHPVIQRKCGKIEQEGTGGFPVGLISGVGFSQFELQLYPGDRLVILSDGVTECPLEGGEFLGEEGLETVLAKLHAATGPGLFDSLMQSLTEISGLEEFPDDVSGLMFEFSGQGHSRPAQKK